MIAVNTGKLSLSNSRTRWVTSVPAAVPTLFAAEIKRNGATGVYIVVDRAQDMLFVVVEDAPSGRMHVEVTLKKFIYDAFER